MLFIILFSHCGPGCSRIFVFPSVEDETDDLSKASQSSSHNATLALSRRSSPRTIDSWCKLWIQMAATGTGNYWKNRKYETQGASPGKGECRGGLWGHCWEQ